MQWENTGGFWAREWHELTYVFKRSLQLPGGEQWSKHVMAIIHMEAIEVVKVFRFIVYILYIPWS